MGHHDPGEEPRSRPVGGVKGIEPGFGGDHQRPPSGVRSRGAGLLAAARRLPALRRDRPIQGIPYGDFGKGGSPGATGGDLAQK